MERFGNKARGRDQGGGGEQGDPGRPGVASSVPRSGGYGWSSEVAARRVPGAWGSTPSRGGASWVNWQSALYLLVLGLVCVPLSSLTSFWWIVPVVGAIVPIALAALDRTRLAPGNLDDGKLKEQELLSALAEVGDLTPAAAAIRTSLTVDEAQKMLEDLARKGHLQPQAGDGVVSYALGERGPREERASGLTGSPGPEPEGGAAAHRLEDPLSDRELEVLSLLASGKTNSEVAGDLFVSLGTVKSHTGNIYRKLDAKNRAEALARARDLDLFR